MTQTGVDISLRSVCVKILGNFPLRYQTMHKLAGRTAPPLLIRACSGPSLIAPDERLFNLNSLAWGRSVRAAGDRCRRRAHARSVRLPTPSRTWRW